MLGDLVMVYDKFDIFDDNSCFGCYDDDISDDKLLDLFCKEAASYDILSLDEQRKLNERILNGDDSARNEYVKHNLRLVISIAKTYVDKEIKLCDLISVGNLGLINASKEYDPSRGVKFSTFAVKGIKFSICNAKRERLVPLPLGVFIGRVKISSAIDDFKIKYNRLPSYKEISSMTGLGLKRIREIYLYSFSYVRLNGFSKEDESELQDVIPCDVNVEEFVCNKLLIEYIFSLLTDDEKQFVLDRYDFIDGKQKTNDEMGKMYDNKSREWARKKNEKILKKIRCNLKWGDF